MTFDHAPRRSSMTTIDRAAQGLGFFSIALGVTELVFPGMIGRAFGLADKKGLMRTYGVREIAAGVGALQPNPGPAIWARAAGDLIDLATLAQGRKSEDASARRNANMALAAVGAITLIDILIAAASTAQTLRPAATRDYGDRSGFPRGPQAARGAMANYTPRDYQVTPRIADDQLAPSNSGARPAAPI